MRYYKNDQAIIRKDVCHISLLQNYDGKSFLLYVYMPDSKMCRLEFKTKAEAEKELSRIYRFLQPNYSNHFVAFAIATFAVAVSTYSLWFPLQ